MLLVTLQRAPTLGDPVIIHSPTTYWLIITSFISIFIGSLTYVGQLLALLVLFRFGRFYDKEKKRSSRKTLKMTTQRGS